MIDKDKQKMINEYVWNPNIYGALMNGNIAQRKYTEEKEIEVDR
jgi:hypothetical protein